MKEIEIPADGANGLFASVMAALNGGATLTELDDSLRQVTEAVGRLSQKGKLTLELTIAPAGTGVGDVPLYSVVADVTTKAPRVARKAQTFFADENNNLTRRSPKQTEMRLHAVETPSSATKAAPESKAANS